SACLFLPMPSRAPIRPPSSERGSDGTTTRIDLAQPHSVRYSGRIRIGVWMAMDIKGALNRLADGKDLTGTEMRDVMEIIMEGGATASQIGAFLMGMRVKGETVGEIAAAVSIMRRKMIPVEAPDDAIDIVGTGGD